MREGTPIGVMNLWRSQVCPFTDKQIELVTTFADQAVIAIENTRLLNELRQRTTDLSEALEQQTATSEVLTVISSSPAELKRVFDAMLRNAVRLCEANFGALFLYDGEVFATAALHRATPAYVEARRRPVVVRDLHPDAPLARLAKTKPGQILISPRVLLAVDKAVNVEPVGEFALKGIRRPMMTYNVVSSSPAKPS
jgi:hypothetical protein